MAKKDHKGFCLPHGSKIKLKLVIFVVECLRENESKFETALANESVDPGVLFDEKKPEVEYQVRLSL
jgi:hypothetical protein